MDWNPANPLARHAAEPSKAHTALCDYAALGAGRSLAQLAEMYHGRPRAGPTKAPVRHLSTLKEWSAEYAWQARVAAYDEAQAAAQLAEREAAWRARAADFREETWTAARAGLDRVRQLLDETAITTTRSEEIVADEHGRRMKVVTIREAPRGTLRDVAALLKAVGDAGRMALGEPTTHERVDVHVTLRSAEELERMTPDEKRAYLDELQAARAALGG